MTSVILDKELREKLNGLNQEVIVFDETGQTVGRFLPEAEYMKMLYERARHMFTDAELERARNQSGGYTTAEVLKHLNSLP